MRKLSLTLVGALLLAGAFLPNVAKASDDNLLRQILSPAPASTSSVDAGCKADLPSGIQGAVFVQTGNGCGTCSDSYCQGGKTIGQACSKGLGYTCQNAIGLECTADPTKWQCTCWPPGVPFP